MSDTDQALRAAIAQSYADFRAEQAARGRPVCDAFEPCKAAQSEPHPWSTAPEFTPCGRCGWSKRTHDPGKPGLPTAEAGGTLRGDGSDGAITIKAEAGAVHVDRPHVATLPTGERVELPAGTVLREGTLPPESEDDRPCWFETYMAEEKARGDGARLAAQEDAARKAASIGPMTYDRARGRISFGPVEVVEAPDLEAGPPKPRT